MSKTGTAAPSAGKIDGAVFERYMAGRMGAARPEVLVGPRTGIDCGIVALGGGQVMAVTTDPLFVLPAYGWGRAAWFAVHIAASDAWTSGLEPRFLTVDLNLPPDLPDADLALLWEAMDGVCRQLGLAVVTGHTGRYDGCALPTIGALTVIGLGQEDAYLTPAMAQVGDAVLLTKGAAIETAGMFGATFPRALAERIGPELAREADALFEQMTVAPDARAAVAAGVRERGVTGMHDATERGVFGGLTEIAAAAGVGMLIDEAAIPIPPAARAVCALLDIDPYSASSEGTLLLTCRPEHITAVLSRLAHAEVAAAVVGEIEPAGAGVRVVRGGREMPLVPPETDPFWPAFSRAFAEWVR